MLLGVIADDFTGASDIANTLAREGMRTRLFGGIPHGGGAEGCEAGVIALKTRSIAPAEAVAQSLEALSWLQAAGCEQILFKYCSTFDSTPQGNIGPVAEALAEALGASGVVVCPAFPGTGRTVYMGCLFVGDVLLSRSGMERHPLNPMTDPDIRSWLALQSRQAPGHVPHGVVRQGAEAIRASLAQLGADHALVVVDAIADEDLRVIGAALDGAPLLTGGSGIALGLPDNFRRAGKLSAQGSAFTPQGGRALVLSGSCSNATRAQVGLYAADHPALEIDIDALLAGQPVQAQVEAFIAANADAAPLIYSTAEPEIVAAFQARYGMARVAEAVEGLFGAVASVALASGVRRMVVAGGETSGAVVTALGLTAMDLGREIDPGVPALSTVTPSGAPLALALKSGNFGAPDFLSKALRRLEVDYE